MVKKTNNSTQIRNKAHLTKILNLLGPGLNLSVDNVNMIAFFGRDTTIAEAKKFAKQHQCDFIENDRPPNDFTGVFIRAYSKKETDE